MKYKFAQISNYKCIGISHLQLENQTLSERLSQEKNSVQKFKQPKVVNVLLYL